MGYKYNIVGYISIYSNKDFSPLKNDPFDFQLALLSNKLEFFDAVFGKTIYFGSSISILQLHWNSENFGIWSLRFHFPYKRTFICCWSPWCLFIYLFSMVFLSVFVVKNSTWFQSVINSWDIFITKTNCAKEMLLLLLFAVSFSMSFSEAIPIFINFCILSEVR